MSKINHNQSRNKKMGWKVIKLSNKTILAIFLAFVLLISTAAILPAPAYANSTQGSNPDEKTTSEYCKSMLGWILCPLLEISGGASDQIYSFIEGQLKINPAILTGGTIASTITDDETGSEQTTTATLASARTVWETFRDTANVLIVILFLIIIFSYVTSFGLNDYNIKKTFPKLIVAIVLINLSFFIVQIAIDVSNLVGSSVKDLFDGMIQSMVMPVRSDAGTVGSYGVSTVLAGVLLWNANKVTPLMSFLFPVIMAIILTSLLVLLLLMIRQAIAILVAVLAPIAFAAMILPNTEKVFSTWKSAFTAVIVTYPVVALLFSGSKLAGSIIIAGSGSNSIMQIMGLALRVVPLIAAPALIQSTMAGVPMVGQAANRMLNRGKNLGMNRAKNSNLVKGQRERWGRKRDTRLSKEGGLNDWIYAKTGGRLGKTGMQKKQEAMDRQARDINNMARSFSTRDLDLFRNSSGGKIDQSQLSDSARFALMANGGDMAKAFAAAAERSALESDANPDDYADMMDKAREQGLSREQMTQTNKRAYANSKASNNLAMESRLESAVKRGGGVNRSRGSTATTAMTEDLNFLQRQNATSLGRATPESLEYMRSAIQQNYNNPSLTAFKNTVESVTSGQNTSAPPGSVQKLDDIINNRP